MANPTDRAIAQAFDRHATEAFHRESPEGVWSWSPPPYEAFKLGYLAALAATPEGAQATPYGWILTGPNGSMFFPNTHKRIIDTSLQFDGMTAVEVYTSPPADAEDAARYRRIAALYNGMKSSTSERFLSCLGIDFFDEQAHLGRTLGELLSATYAARDSEGA